MTPSQTEQRAEEVVARALPDHWFPSLRAVFSNKILAALRSAGLLRTPGTVEVPDLKLKKPPPRRHVRMSEMGIPPEPTP